MFELLLSAYILGTLFSAVIGVVVLLNLKRGFLESVVYSVCMATFWPIAIPLILRKMRDPELESSVA